MGKKIVVFIIVVAILSVGLFLFLTNRKVSQDIPDGYIAIFHGDPGEKTYLTYIYKEDNESNTGFEYINVIVTSSVTNGNTQVHNEVTERGKLTWSSEVYGVAQKNNAYTFVTRPNDDTQYTIEQFENQILPKLK